MARTKELGEPDAETRQPLTDSTDFGVAGQGARHESGAVRQLSSKATPRRRSAKSFELVRVCTRSGKPEVAQMIVLC